MIRALFLVFFTVMVSAPSYAQQSVCDSVVEHKAAADVAYQPGVDVDGNAVVPADLNGGMTAVDNTLLYPIRVPLQIDVAEYLGVDLSAVANGALDLNQTQVGYVELQEDGRVFYNGQDLTSRLADACAKPDGQEMLAGLVKPAHKPNAPIKKTVIETDIDPAGGQILEGQFP